jgi:ABC-type bacteriocin/lantibiotic exporter with double-glycine peptidase domain
MSSFCAVEGAKKTAESSARDLEGLRGILEQLGILGLVASREDVLRAWDQAMLWADGALDWPQAVTDICTALKLRSQVLECTPEQAIALVTDGARIIARHGEAWVVVAVDHHGRPLLLDSNDLPGPSCISAEALAGKLGEIADDSLLRAVAIQPRPPITATATRRSPLARLWAILQPEQSDIWTVIVFAAVIAILTLATPIAVEILVNTVAFGRLFQPVVVLSLILLTFMAFAGALRACQVLVVEIIQQRLFARVVADLSFRLPRVQLAAFDGKSPRELVNRFFDVVVVQKAAAGLLLDGVTLVIGTLVGMAMLAVYHPWLLGFDLLLLLMLGIAVFGIGQGAVQSSIKESKAKYHAAAWLEELAANSTTFRQDHSAAYALERADHLTFAYLSARKKHFRILMRQIVFALAMQAIASTLLLGLGGWLVVSGELTLGQLVAAELIVALIVAAFAKLGKHLESFYDLLASVDKLGVLFDLPIERQEGMVPPSSFPWSELSIENVGYQAPEGKHFLSDVKLMLERGDRVAVVGPGGSGKSLLFDLIFGLREPTAGQIKIGGVDIREMRSAKLRQHIALVRGCEAFEGSVWENIRLGRPDISASDARQALADVGLLNQVLRLPDQLDTHLSDFGFPLTPSQARKLMLARACAGKPGLLLIDGALDALPDEEARRLMSWLCRAEHPWSLLVATGRESIASMCDRRIEFSNSDASFPAGVERSNKYVGWPE